MSRSLRRSQSCIPPRPSIAISNSSADSATCVISGSPRSRAAAPARRSNSGVVEYGACGDSPSVLRQPAKESTVANASRKICSGGRRLFTPVISRNDTTRNGVACHTSGSNSGTASTSATVVTPLRSSIRAPPSHDIAKSEYSHSALKPVIQLIQSTNDRCCGIAPPMPV